MGVMIYLQHIINNFHYINYNEHILQSSKFLRLHFHIQKFLQDKNTLGDHYFYYNNHFFLMIYKINKFQCIFNILHIFLGIQNMCHCFFLLKNDILGISIQKYYHLILLNQKICILYIKIYLDLNIYILNKNHRIFNNKDNSGHHKILVYKYNILY